MIVWDVGCGEAVNVIDCHPDVIYSMSFNRDGSLIATTCKDKKLRIIEPRRGIVLSVSFGYRLHIWMYFLNTNVIWTWQLHYVPPAWRIRNSVYFPDRVCLCVSCDSYIERQLFPINIICQLLFVMEMKYCNLDECHDLLDVHIRVLGNENKFWTDWEGKFMPIICNCHTVNVEWYVEVNSRIINLNTRLNCEVTISSIRWICYLGVSAFVHPSSWTGVRLSFCICHLKLACFL